MPGPSSCPRRRASGVLSVGFWTPASAGGDEGQRPRWFATVRPTRTRNLKAAATKVQPLNRLHGLEVLQGKLEEVNAQGEDVQCSVRLKAVLLVLQPLRGPVGAHGGTVLHPDGVGSL